MKKPNLVRFLIPLLLALCAAPLLAAPQGTLVEIENRGTKLVFHPVTEFNELILTVTGPCAFEFRQVIRPGEVGVFVTGETTIDGRYRFDIQRHQRIDEGVISALKEARLEGDAEVPKKLCRLGMLPDPPSVQAAAFTVKEFRIIYDPSIHDGKAAGQIDFDEFVAKVDAPLASTVPGAGAGGVVPTKDFVILDDLIVDGSACIGFDCVNGEVFSFDTIRLKENNLRIKFDDTSVAASFPANDWQLVANDSANGGASKFSIEDVSGGRTPFTVEANARSHSLYVDDGGRIGSRTSTPSTEIHTIDGDTPTLRLQQDGSSGFTPQTWDVAGNETNFFIRDVTNGSTLPFRIRPGAPTSSIFVDIDGDVGIGTASPDEALHVRRTNGSAKILIEEASATNADRELIKVVNDGTTRFSLESTSASGNNWRFASANNGDFTINAEGLGLTQMRIEPTGDVTIPAGAMYNGSDRNKKTGFAPVDTAEVLAKLTQLPLSSWSWIHDPNAVRHLGPMAQDFHAAFGLGKDEISIGTLDVAGVAIAAIQGLNNELEEKDEKIDDLEGRIAELERLVQALAAR